MCRGSFTGPVGAGQLGNFDVDHALAGYVYGILVVLEPNVSVSWTVLRRCKEPVEGIGVDRAVQRRFEFHWIYPLLFGDLVGDLNGDGFGGRLALTVGIHTAVIVLSDG